MQLDKAPNPQAYSSGPPPYPHARHRNASLINAGVLMRQLQLVDRGNRGCFVVVASLASALLLSGLTPGTLCNL